MISAGKRQRVIDVLAGNKSGLYTDGEVISICMELMDNEDERLGVWQDLPKWVAERIVSRLKAFADTDEIVTFGSASPTEAKARILNLKAWLVSRNGV